MIIINARFLTQPISGVQRFAIEISKELKKSGCPIVFLTPKNIIQHELAKELDAKVLGILSGHLWEQIELQTYVLYKRAFLLSFCNTAPLFVKNQIITVHDLSFKIHPEWFSKQFSTFYNFMIPAICANAKAIITVSNSSKKELHDILGISNDKISVVYNAVASIFEDKQDEKDINSPIDGDYVLTVSSHHPRKNYKRLIEAFKLINNKNLKLCIVGNVNKHFSDVDIEVDENVIFVQNLDDLELKNYYRHASLFVFPSVYEGFGIPIIEAMQFNVPVCVSDIPVFHEICGDNAAYFDPFSVNDIKNKIIDSLKVPVKTKDTNLESYSWQKGASIISELIKIY
jgi:glycosyltransferase involved in cell wall biosynthesis